MAANLMSVSLKPDVELAEIEAAAEEEPEDILTSFEEFVNDLENPEKDSHFNS